MSAAADSATTETDSEATASESDAPHDRSDAPQFSLLHCDFVMLAMVVEYNFLRKLDPVQCHQEMKVVFKQYSPELPTIYLWYQKLSRHEPIHQESKRPGRPENSELIERIKSRLKQDQNMSASRIAQFEGCALTTVTKTLRHKLRLRRVTLRWVPYLLTDTIRDARVLGATNILPLLRLAKSTKFATIITGDESWIYLDNPLKSVWIPEGAPRPTQPKLTISAKKYLLTVFFNGQGLQAIHWLEKGTMNSDIFINQVLKPLNDKYQA
jgi:hypothetical protein